MSTDVEWERWGAADPYYGVLTNPKFRLAALTPEARDEFFASGRMHVSYVLDTCRRRIDPAFAPRTVLDFGCGVGRLLIAFAAASEHAVGVDVSASMRAEAARNCEAYQVSNITLLPSDDELSAVVGDFDLVHSCIVLQHIEVDRGRALFRRLAERVRPGGIGALHVTFAWDHYSDSFGQPTPPQQPPDDPSPGVLRQVKSRVRQVLEPLGILRPPPPVEVPEVNPDPEMQMNYYNLSELMFILQQCGVSQVHADMTNHGGALGSFLFFRRG